MLLPSDAGTSTEGDTRARVSMPDNLASILLVVAAVLFVINVRPCLQVGFYQDEFPMLDALQHWGWNWLRAAAQEGYQYGYRPLTSVLRLLVWNLWGERPVLHNLLLACVHLGFGWILLCATRLLGEDRLHRAVVLALYFGSVIASQTLYSTVYFFPSDLLCLLTVLIMMAAVNRQWSAPKVTSWTIVVGMAALASKENGISASLAVILVTLALWRRLSRQHRVLLLASHTLLLAAYLLVTVYVLPARRLSAGAINFSAPQALRVLRGIALSLVGPFFTGLYVPLRELGCGKVLALFGSALAFAGFLWLAYGGDIACITKALRARLPLGVMVTLLTAAFLVPYLPGTYFEQRMLVSTWAMGTLLWGIVLADALRAWTNQVHAGGGVPLWVGGAMVVALATLSAGSPVPASVYAEQKTGVRMRQIVREAQSRKVQCIALVGFRTKGSALRLVNAKGLIGYESKRQVGVQFFDDATQLPNPCECVSITYDEAVVNEVPLTVSWPSVR